MPLDALYLSALTAELSSSLEGGKIDKIQQPERDALLFTVRADRKNLKLLASAATGSAGIYITAAQFENPDTPPMFCMLLRKHIGGARIAEITQLPLERILDIRLEAFSELGEQSVKHLIIELIGARPNIILADDELRIIDCLRRSDSEKRPVLPGLFYRRPPEMGKKDPLHTTREEFLELAEKTGGEFLCDRFISDNFAGISQLTARELAFLAFGACDSRLADGPEKLWEAFSGLAAAAAAGSLGPWLLLRGEEAKDFSYMPIRQYGPDCENRRFDSFSALLDEYYTRKNRAGNMRQRSQDMLKTINTLRTRTARKLAAREKEMLEAEKRDELKKSGDLIMANLYRLKRGDRLLRAEDFYSDTGGEVEIKLDPLLSPQDNAAAYYKKYKKAKTAVVYLNENIEKAKTELDYLESVLEEIERASSPAELFEIRAELSAGGYISPQRGKGRAKAKAPESSPLHFTSSSGFDIYVGKNNSQNDILTFKTAMRGDIWLHAQKIHGAHVIIASGGREVDEKTILQAASLAAYYSRGRESGRVPVDYTAVKFVRKPPGGKPGAAVYTEYSTVYAVPAEKI